MGAPSMSAEKKRKDLSLEEQVDLLTRERDGLIRAIDNLKVFTCHNAARGVGIVIASNAGQAAQVMQHYLRALLPTMPINVSPKDMIEAPFELTAPTVRFIDVSQIDDANAPTIITRH